MKVQDLFEMPRIIKTELESKHPMRMFYSEDTIRDNFEFIHRGETAEGEEFWVLIRKNLAFASIGVPGVRKDGKPGMDILGTVDFKQVHLSGLKRIPVGKNVLQVSLVEISPNRIRRGYGLYLYTSLAEAGYVVVSDNTQYLGGVALWKRIASETLQGQYNVYIIQDGEVLLDDSGEPVTYDASNIEDAELWSEDSKYKYTLFALKAV